MWSFLGKKEGGRNPELSCVNTASNAATYIDSARTCTLTAGSYVTASNTIGADYFIYYDSSYRIWLDGNTIKLSVGDNVTSQKVAHSGTYIEHI